MPVRQVQAHEVPRHHLREVRRRSHARQGAPRAHGPYRAREPGRPYLVPQVPPEPHRPHGRPHAQGAREDPLFRELRRARPGRDRPQAVSAADRGRPALQAGRVRRGFRGRHRRRSHQEDPPRHRHRRREGQAARRPQGHHQRGQAQEAGQAPQADRSLQRERRQAGMDDPRGRPGHPARAAPARPARRRPLRHVRPERPVSPRHQPQQPPQAPDRAPRARHHRA